MSARFELLIEVGAFGVGGEECRVFLGGHVKVLIDLARLAKLQFQHAFLGSAADAGDAAGLHRNSLHSRIERPPGCSLSLDADDFKEGTADQGLISSVKMPRVSALSIAWSRRVSNWNKLSPRRRTSMA